MLLERRPGPEQFPVSCSDGRDMHLKLSFIDEVALAREFATDDRVRKTTHTDAFHSPYVGRVLYSDQQTGKVMVQWPWGPEHEQPSELIRDASEAAFPPLLLDQLPDTVERQTHRNSDADFKADVKYRKSLGTTINRVAHIHEYEQRVKRIAARFEQHTLPIKKATCLAFHQGMDEVQAFLAVSEKHASQFGSEPIRLTVSNFYETARRIAIYWKDSNRRYKVTNKERASGKLKCPRCGTIPLKPRAYRQGKKVLACGSCGFAISPKDLV